MVSRLFRSEIIWRKIVTFALVALVSSVLISCGKKDGKPQIDTSTPQDTSTQEPEVNADREVEEESEGSGREIDEGGLLRERSPSDLVGDFVRGRGHGYDGNLEVDHAGLTPDILHPRDIHPLDLYRHTVPSYTGAHYSGNYFYSGAGQDNILSLLLSTMDSRESGSGTAADKALAQKIHRFRVEVKSGGRIKSSFIFWEDLNGNDRLHYHYEGRLNENRVAQMTMTSDCPDRFDLKITCMDAGSTCQIKVARILEKQPENPARAFVVERNTNAHVYMEVDSNKVDTNPLYATWFAFTKNTERYLEGGGTRLPLMHYMSLQSSAVVNGEASYLVTMGIEQANQAREYINFSGPLVKNRSNWETNIPVDLNPSVQGWYQGNQTQLSESYRDLVQRAQLIGNDGRGNLRFQISLSDRNSGLSTPVFYSFLRDHVEIDYSRLSSAVRN